MLLNEKAQYVSQTAFVPFNFNEDTNAEPTKSISILQKFTYNPKAIDQSGANLSLYYKFAKSVKP